MTYKLNPELRLITSPVMLIFPDHTTRRFSSREDVVRETFDRRWKVVDIRAAGDVIEICLEPMTVPEVNAIGEETFF